MIDYGHKLTVDDLIVEYMMYKVRNNYEPSFLISEFLRFLCFFKSKMAVEDSLYEGPKLFEMFFEKKNEHDWAKIEDFRTMKKHAEPHMEMIYSKKDNDYLIKANNKLSDFDRSVINTRFMGDDIYGKSNINSKIAEIRSIIDEFLSQVPKRKIDELIEVDEKELMIGKIIATQIVVCIWNGYINDQIKNKKWPIQCKDMNKYLLEIDLAKIIGVKSIKKDLLELYSVLSRRIAIMFKQDRNLKISTYFNNYLARSNYDLLIQGYEAIVNIAFGNYRNFFTVDLSTLEFDKNHEFRNIDCCNNDSYQEIATITSDEHAKDLVKILDRNVMK